MTAKEDLQNIKEKFLGELTELLKNKGKKNGKQLQAEAEKLFANFKQEVNDYQKNRTHELEEINSKHEQAKLNELYSQLDKL